MGTQPNQPARPRVEKALVHCMICTHNVEADIVVTGRNVRVRTGQKCARCGSSLDAGAIVRFDRAA